MAKREDVESFLGDLKTKIAVFSIHYRDDRGKNAQALLDLELTPAQRTDIIKNLTYADYSDGPLEETLYGSTPMWVFGKLIKSKEVYIKITLGHSDSNVLCISFHVAERSLSYPFKKGKI